MPGAIGFYEIEWEMPKLQYFWPGDFLTSIRETMVTPETSHAAAIEPLTLVAVSSNDKFIFGAKQMIYLS